MQVIAIALMGFLAFTGSVAPSVEAQTKSADIAEPPLSALALADEARIVRAVGAEALTMDVKMTSYNAVAAQTDGNPLITASGLPTNPEIMAARSVDLAGKLPFGTVIALERTALDTPRCRYSAVEHLIGYRVIGDSMHSRKVQQIDVQLNQNDTVVVDGRSVNPSLALGVCDTVTIKVVGRLSLSDIPATQEELRRIVEGDAVAMR